MNAAFRLGEPSELTISDGKRCVTAYGAAPRKAESSPLTKEALTERLCKLGGTFLTAKKISVHLDEEINLSPAEINALRRSAVDLLVGCEREPISSQDTDTARTPISKNAKAHRATDSFVSAEFHSMDAYDEIIKQSPQALKYFDLVFLPITEDIPSFGGAAIPPVLTDSELCKAKELLVAHKSRGVKYALCSNLGALRLARECGLTPIGNFRLNVTNGESLEVYRALGVERLILSPELTLPQARDIGGSVIGYGRIPLMLTERCFIKENFGCQRCKSAALTDRRGERFPLVYEYGHRNLILNSRITYIGDKPSELSRYGVHSVHFIFTTETAEQIKTAIDSFKHHTPLSDTEVRRIGGRGTPSKRSLDKTGTPKAPKIRAKESKSHPARASSQKSPSPKAKKSN